MGSRSNLTSADASRYFVDLACSDGSKFDLATSEDYSERCDALAGAKPLESKADFEDLEKRLGCKYNPSGLIASIGLRLFFKPGKMICQDPMHLCCSNGIVGQEIFLVLEVVRKYGQRKGAVADASSSVWTLVGKYVGRWVGCFLVIAGRASAN